MLHRLRPLLCLLLAMLLFASGGLAEYDQPITFRGIPWGISLPDALDRLADEGIAMPDPKAVDKLVEECFCGEHMTFHTFQASSDAPVTVAGDDVQQVSLYALAGVTDDGTIGTSADDSRLYRCTYIYGYWDYDTELKAAEDVYSALAIKLTLLYGAGETSHDETVSGGAVFVAKDTTVWYGSGNTAVILSEVRTFSKVRVYVDYWDTTCCDMFMALAAAAPELSGL